VTGVATLVHGGRTLASYEIVITDDEGQRLCTSRLTCIIRDNIPAGGSGRAGEALPLLKQSGSEHPGRRAAPGAVGH
jgi:hypothetical protein